MRMIPDSIKKILKEETEKSLVTEFEREGGGKYPYAILPLESFATPEYFHAVREGLKYMLKDEIARADAILSIEAKAYLVTPSLAEELNLPHIAVRKRNYNVKQLVINQKKAYRGGQKLYCVGINRLEKGASILIVDDMISSGWTVLGTVEALEKEDFKIAGIGSVYERGDGIENIRKAGYNVKGLMRLEIKNKKPFVSRFYGD